MRSIELSTNHLAYDEKRSQIIASLSASVGEATEVALIDPNGGKVVRKINVGPGPDALAISDDGSTLYVGLDAEGSIRRVDLEARTPGATFSLPHINDIDHPIAAEIAFQPGSAFTAAASVGARDATYGYGPIIFDKQTARPDVYLYPSARQLAWISSTRLLGFDSQTSSAIFSGFTIGASGVSLADYGRRGGAEYSKDLLLAGNRLYLGDGSVLDAASLNGLGKFPIPASLVRTGPAVDVAAKRAYFVGIDSENAPILHVYDTETFAEVAERSLPAIPRGLSDFVSGTGDLMFCGAHTLAFRTSDRVYLIDSVPTL